MLQKQIKDAILDLLMSRIDRENYGMLSTYRMSLKSEVILEENHIHVTSKLRTTDTVTQNGKVIATVKYRYAAREVNCNHKMLKPQIIYAPSATKFNGKKR